MVSDKGLKNKRYRKLRLELYDESTKRMQRSFVPVAFIPCIELIDGEILHTSSNAAMPW